MFGLFTGILTGALAGDVAAATDRGSASRPNIVLLLSDDQRPDTIRALGNDSIHTPHLDRLVREGTAFTRAISAYPICTPSRAEIMTGSSAFSNGVFDFGGKIDPTAAVWAETMRRAGYHTSYVGKWHNDGRPNARGYEETIRLLVGGTGRRWAIRSYDWKGRTITGYRGWAFESGAGDPEPERGFGLSPNISEQFADAAIEFLRRKTERSFFLHVNFTAPHDPLLMPFGYEGMYDPKRIALPPNFLTKHPFDHGNYHGRDEKLLEWPRSETSVRNELAVYYAVITHMDEQIGRIMKALDETGQRENTIVIFSSDHGLAMGSHGLRGKQNMYEHTIGVPLVMSGPGIPRGERIDAQCYVRDLFPTVCDLAGIEIPASVEGKSLRPVLENTTPRIYSRVFAYFRNLQRMVRTDRWKLVYYPHLDHYQLFDLRNDPHELHDLSADPRFVATFIRLRRMLNTWQQDVGDPLLAE